jgi:hypothetical protein
MKYTRVYADAMGETHYDEVEVAVAPADFAPPTPPVYLSTFHPAMQWSVRKLTPRIWTCNLAKFGERSPLIEQDIGYT